MLEKCFYHWYRPTSRTFANIKLIYFLGIIRIMDNTMKNRNPQSQRGETKPSSQFSEMKTRTCAYKAKFYPKRRHDCKSSFVFFFIDTVGNAGKEKQKEGKMELKQKVACETAY